jgi:hypothetical protein
MISAYLPPNCGIDLAVLAAATIVAARATAVAANQARSARAL